MAAGFRIATLAAVAATATLALTADASSNA
jgi:hypothetical protein